MLASDLEAMPRLFTPVTPPPCHPWLLDAVQDDRLCGGARVTDTAPLLSTRKGAGAWMCLGLLWGTDHLKAHYSSLYFGFPVLKIDVLAVGEGERVHFLSQNHAESNIVFYPNKISAFRISVSVFLFLA